MNVKSIGSCTTVVAVAVTVTLGLATGASAAPPANAKVAFLSDRSGAREIYTMNRDSSNVRRLTFNDLVERQPVWSPDRSRIAFAGRAADGNWDIYTVHADGEGLARLTNDAARDDDPSWTPDGGQIVYDHGVFACPCSLRSVNADGSNDHLLNAGEGNSFSPDVAPAGGRIVFANDRTGGYALYTMKLTGGDVRPLTDGTSDFDASWAPDGRRVAFTRDTGNGDNELYVVNENGKELTRLTDTPNRAEFAPAWASDGKEILFFADSPARLHAIRPDGSGETQLSTSYAAPYVDDFNDNRRESGFWHEIVAGTNISIAETNGRVEVTVLPGAQPGGQFNVLDAHYGMNCQAPGDFDEQIDYTLLEWPSANGFRASLAAYFANAFVQRESQPWGEQYSVFLDPSFYAFPTSDTSGSFRLVRSGGFVTGYFLNGLTWVPIASAPANGIAGVLGFAVGATADLTDQPVKVAFDNFRLNSGLLECPTWWNESWPDAQLNIG
jgi:dipeptidyl aminopeptidase/acylaminoacyl peptidase